MKTYYAYLHARPGASSAKDIFYVGKGTRRRSHDFKSNRNEHYKNVVAKHGKDSIMVSVHECSTEAFALELEIGLIKTLRRMGVALTNQTNGGDGVSGCVISAKNREATSKRFKGRAPANKGMPSPLKGIPLSKEHREKLSLAKTGKASPRKGAQVLPSTKGLISAAFSGRVWINDGTKSKLVTKDESCILLGQGFKRGRISSKRLEAHSI